MVKSVPSDVVNTIVSGHALDVLKKLPAACVHTCVTSPPYWGLRSYGTEPQVWGGEPECDHNWQHEARIVETTEKGGHWQQANNGQGMASGKLWTRFRGDTKAATRKRTFGTKVTDFCAKCGAWRGELGLEPTPALYVKHVVEIFREVRRVLREDGTLWLNMGDCYHSGDRGGYRLDAHRWEQSRLQRRRKDRGGSGIPMAPNRLPQAGLKDKDLVGIPWMVALALRSDGWHLRSDIIWHKPNPMPESVRDRPTRAHEYLFLFSKNRRYHYDARAIAEPLASGPSDLKKMAEGLERLGGKHLALNDPLPAASALTNIGRRRAVGPRFRSGNLERDIPQADDGRGIPNDHRGRSIPWEDTSGKRNARSVWTVPTQPFSGAHFATFPLELAKRCILAGASPQACERCGTPWERISEQGARRAAPGQGGSGYKLPKAKAAGSDKRVKGRSEGWLPNHFYPVQTVGWKPACNCENLGGGYCIVLDPFIGSGTTAEAALRLGHQFIGIELNGSYANMATRRVMPLLQRQPKRVGAKKTA